MVRSVLHTWHFSSALWLVGQHTVRGASTWAHASCTMVQLLIIVSSELANNVTAVFAGLCTTQQGTLYSQVTCTLLMTYVVLVGVVICLR